MIRWVQNRMLGDFGTIWASHFESCLGAEGQQSFFVWFLFFCADFDLHSGRTGLLKRGFRIDCITKKQFSTEIIFDYFGVGLWRVSEASRTVLLIFAAVEIALQIDDFLMGNQIQNP